MPPRTRKTAEAPAPAGTILDAQTEEGAAPDAELPCPECFPLGWPDGATSTGCHHGSWLREVGD